MKPAGSHGVSGGVLRVAVAWVNIGSIPSTPVPRRAALAACAPTVIDSTHASHSMVIFGGSGSLFFCISSVEA